MQFDDELRKALRAEDPGAAFTQRVLARAREQRVGRETATAHEPQASSAGRAIRAVTAADAVDAAAPAPASANVSAAKPPLVTLVGVTNARRARTVRWIAGVLAASIALAAAGLQWQRHLDYIEQGERARAEVLAALRITSEKLNLVHDKITESSEAR